MAANRHPAEIGWEDQLDTLNRQADEVRFLSEHTELPPQMLNLIKQVLSDFAYTELLHAEKATATEMLESITQLVGYVYPIDADKIR